VIRESIRLELLSIKDEYCPSLDAEQAFIDHFQGFNKGKWNRKDDEGIVNGKPMDIEMDILFDTQVTYIYEIKPIIGLRDIMHILKLGKFYRQNNPTVSNLRCVFITKKIDPRAQMIAEVGNVDFVFVN